MYIVIILATILYIPTSLLMCLSSSVCSVTVLLEEKPNINAKLVLLAKHSISHSVLILELMIFKILKYI